MVYMSYAFQALLLQSVPYNAFIQVVYWAICEIFQVILINSKLLLSTRISCRYYTSLYPCNLIEFCSVIGKTYKPQWITRVETLTNNEKIEVYQTNYNISKNYAYHENILGQNHKTYFFFYNKNHNLGVIFMLTQLII